MAYSDNLPFERGTTFWEGDSDSISATDPSALALVGKRFTVPDTENNLGIPVTLQVVRNVTGSAITVAKGTGYDYDTDYPDMDADSTAADGGYGHVIDDAYPASYSIPDDDLFYVVVEGPVAMLADSNGVTKGEHVAFTGSGKVESGSNAASGDYLIGVARETFTSGNTGIVIAKEMGVK